MFNLVRAYKKIYDYDEKLKKSRKITNLYTCDEYNFVETISASFWYIKDAYTGVSIKERNVFLIAKDFNFIIPNHISNIIINNEKYSDDELIFILGKKYMDENFIRMLDDNSILFV